MESLSSELREPLWLLTWDQLERFGPLDVRMALRSKRRVALGNEPVALHQEAWEREG